MNTQVKIILVVFVAGVAVAMNPYKRWKEFATTTIFEKSLPNKKNVDRFDLGQIVDHADIKNIKALNDDESKVMLEFKTADGEPVRALIRRTVLHGHRLHKLKLKDDAKPKTIDHANKMLGRLKHHLGKKAHLSMTAWYRFDPESKRWKQIYTVTDESGNNRYENGVDVRVYENGIGIFHAPGKKLVITSLTGEPIQTSQDKTSLVVGQNKEVSASDLLNINAGAQPVVEGSGELP